MSIEACPDGPTPVYDVCVVSRGLMGSAAGRHLAANGANVVAVGPPECKSARKAEVEIFGAHYDEGRITRRTDLDPVRALLAQRFIGRLRKERGGALSPVELSAQVVPVLCVQMDSSFEMFWKLAFYHASWLEHLTSRAQFKDSIGILLGRSGFVEVVRTQA